MSLVYVPLEKLLNSYHCLHPPKNEVLTAKYCKKNGGWFAHASARPADKAVPPARVR
jgi:hypothetical protein